jgi:hypothetical protein
MKSRIIRARNLRRAALSPRLPLLLLARESGLSYPPARWGLSGTAYTASPRRAASLNSAATMNSQYLLDSSIECRTTCRMARGACCGRAAIRTPGARRCERRPSRHAAVLTQPPWSNTRSVQAPRPTTVILALFSYLLCSGRLLRRAPLGVRRFVAALPFDSQLLTVDCHETTSLPFYRMSGKRPCRIWPAMAGCLCKNQCSFHSRVLPTHRKGQRA